MTRRPHRAHQRDSASGRNVALNTRTGGTYDASSRRARETHSISSPSSSADRARERRSGSRSEAGRQRAGEIALRRSRPLAHEAGEHPTAQAVTAR